MDPSLPSAVGLSSASSSAWSPALSPGVAIALGTALVLFGAVVPTCLYLYVEPRGRRTWGVPGDRPETRRAPLVVRATAWASFAVGQLAIPGLVVPVACAGLLYVQTRLGILRPLGCFATLAVGVAAVAQSLAALRLFPLGVRLLARDPRLAARADKVARMHATISAAALGVAAALGWGLGGVPGLIHPWLRVALDWSAVKPVLAFAGLGLLHALLLGLCTRALLDPSSAEEK